MIATLTLVFCLAANPTQCQTIEPQSDEDMYQIGLSSCAQHGEILAQLWLDDHPKWAYGKVRCAMGRQPRAQAT